MEMEEDEQLCNNCKRPVSSANFALHSAFCERNIYVCNVCEEPVQISEKNQHLEEYHVISPCDLCETAIEKWMLPKHMEACPRRPIICDYCEADFPFNEHSEHAEFCGSRTEKCLLCQKYVMIRNKAKHDKIHKCEKEFHRRGIEEEIKQNKVNEVISKTNVTENDTSEKTSKRKSDSIIFKKETVSRLEPEVEEEAEALLPDKFKSTFRRDDERFETLSDEGAAATASTLSDETKRVYKSKHYTQCPICKQDIQWIDLNTHVPTCASAAGKCALCGEEVLDHQMKAHMKEHYQNKSQNPTVKMALRDESFDDAYTGENKNLKCPYCRQLFSEDLILDHTRNCPSNIYKCPLCYENVPERDKAKHEASDCKVMYDEAYNFSRSSSQSLFECPLCGANIPDENKDTHMSFECKALLESSETRGLYNMKNDSSDVYDCPLCLKSMLMKDKKRHESFDCTVLIENNTASQIYEKTTFADVAKKTYGGNSKDCSEICTVCKNRIPRNKMAEHARNCKRVKLPCQLCKHMIDVACEDIHMKSCPALTSDKNYSNNKSRAIITSNSSNNEHKGAISKNTSLRDMLRPKTAKCKYCETTLNADILKYHEEECVHLPVECSDCSKMILVKDLGIHKCKAKKGKGRNQKRDQQVYEDRNPSLKKKVLQFFGQSSQKEEAINEEASRESYQQSFYSSHGYIPNEGGGNHHYQDYSGIANELFPCEFCSKMFPALELVLHETGCEPHLVSYAKPNSSEDSMPTKNQHSVPIEKTQNSNISIVRSPFFTATGDSISSPPAKHERIKPSRESDVAPGEYLKHLSNNGSFEHHKHPVKNDNIAEGKKTKPLNLQAVWNADFSMDSKTESDNSPEISNDSDEEMDVDHTGESSYRNEREIRDLKEHVEKVPENLDSEMTTIFDFLSENENSKYDEGCENILGLENSVSKSLETEKCNVLNSNLLDGETQEKYMKDLPVSETMPIGEESNIICRESSAFIDNTNENQEEYVKNFRQHLSDFKFTTRDTITSNAKDNEHNTILPEKVDKLGKVHKCEVSIYTVGTKDEEEDASNFWVHQPDLKCDDKTFLSSKKDPHHSELSEMNVLTEKLYKQKITVYTSSTKVEKENINNFRQQMSDFKFGNQETKSSETNVYNNVLPQKNLDKPGNLFGQKISISTGSAKNEKEDAKNFGQYLPDFRFRFGPVGNELSDITTVKKSEKLHQITSSLLDIENEDSKECAKPLLDFDNVYQNTQEVEKCAFKLEPVLNELIAITTDVKSEKFNQMTPSLLDGENKVSEGCTRPLLDFDNLYQTTQKVENRAFKIEPAESFLKEARLSIQTAINKEKKEIEDLDEKIAKWQKRYLSPDTENDSTKWRKWRDKTSNSSDSD